MSLVKFSILYITAFFCFFAVPIFAAHAQTESFSFNVSPQNPKPNETVYVSISSFSVDLTRAYITWELDEDLILSGTGEVRTSFKTKDLGEPSVLRVSASFGGGSELVKTLVVQPATVDVLWEVVDSYTPPFYKGKALAGRESRIKIVAMPEVKSYGGTQYNATDLIYSWRRNGENQPGASGYGKQYFSFLHTVLEQDQEVSVTVRSKDGFSEASGRGVVNFTSPIIGLYKETTRGGVDFTQELTQKRFSSDGQMSIVAIPYHFSTDGGSEKGLTYTWRVNDNTVTPPTKKNKITIQKSGNEGGSALVELVIENITKLFQEDSRRFEVELR